MTSERFATYYCAADERIEPLFLERLLGLNNQLAIDNRFGRQHHPVINGPPPLTQCAVTLFLKDGCFQAHFLGFDAGGGQSLDSFTHLLGP